jgi:hypothetical protein
MAVLSIDCWSVEASPTVFLAIFLVEPNAIRYGGIFLKKQQDDLIR